MKKVFIAVLLCVLSRNISSANVQSINNTSSTIWSADRGKYEYVIINKDGETVNKDTFVDIGYLNEKSYYVRKKNNNNEYKYGIIDKNGRYIAEPRYDYITGCGIDMYCASTFDKNNKDATHKSYLINGKGKIIDTHKYISPVYSYRSEVNNKLIMASDTDFSKESVSKKIFFYDENYKHLFDTNSMMKPRVSFDYIVVSEGIKDRNGDIFINDEINDYVIKNGKKYYLTKNSGVIDENGKTIVSKNDLFDAFHIKSSECLSSGVPVRDCETPSDYIWTEENASSGGLNPHYSECYDFNGNLIKNPDMNTAPYGKLTTLKSNPGRYSVFPYYRRDEFLFVSKKDTKDIGVYTLNGKKIIPVNKESCGYNAGFFDCTGYELSPLELIKLKTNHAVFFFPKYYSYIYDKKGKLITKFKYNEQKTNQITEALIFYKNKYKPDFLYKRKALKEYEKFSSIFDSPGPNKQGGEVSVYSFTKDYKLYIFDENCNDLIKENYDFLRYYGYIEDEHTKIYLIEKDGKCGIINHKGEYLLPVEYEQFDSTLYNYQDKYITAKKNGKWGLVNLKNEVVYDFVFDEAPRVFLNDNIAVVKRSI